jgi:hypothetical protein
MIRTNLKLLALAGLVLSSGAAFADDPTSVLLRERGEIPTYAPPGFPVGTSFVGPCAPGTEAYSFPTGNGYRCIPFMR